jgi:hypothetical protein
VKPLVNPVAKTDSILPDWQVEMMPSKDDSAARSDGERTAPVVFPDADG